MNDDALPTTEAILPRVARGELGAARACIDRYGGLVWALARRFSSTSEDAEDAVQEIFLELWKSAARFDAAVASEVTFVAMVTRRRLIDRRRAHGRTLRAEPIHAMGNDEPRIEASGETSADVAAAAKAVATLRPDQQRVLLLSARDGLSHSEIAKELSMPLGTVKANARRGLIAVRNALFGGSMEGEEES